MAEPSFQLRVGRSGGTLVVAPRGELDIATVPELTDALAGTAAEDVVVDLRGVEFIDSSGIAGVLEAWRRAREAGGSLRAVQGPPEVQRVLGMVSLDDTLEWVEPPGDVTWVDRDA